MRFSHQALHLCLHSIASLCLCQWWFRTDVFSVTFITHTAWQRKYDADSMMRAWCNSWRAHLFQQNMCGKFTNTDLLEWKGIADILQEARMFLRQRSTFYHWKWVAQWLCYKTRHLLSTDQPDACSAGGCFIPWIILPITFQTQLPDQKVSLSWPNESDHHTWHMRHTKLQSSINDRKETPLLPVFQM